MIKKLIAVGVIGLVGAYVVGQTKVGSHIQSWVNQVGNKLEDSVTPETELARIKNEVAQLDSDVNKVKADLAEAIVNSRMLRKEVEDLGKQAADSEAAARKHAKVIDAASENSQIEWGNRKLSRKAAKEQLQTEVNRAKELKARLKTQEQALSAQEQTRDLVDQQLQEMLKQKEELNSAVANMEAEIRLAKVEQIRSKYQNDGSRMGEIKTSLADLRKKIMVQREKLHVEENYAKTPASEKSVDDILSGLDNDAPAATTEVKVIEKK